jgi:hypothetical protein
MIIFSIFSNQLQYANENLCTSGKKLIESSCD